MTVPKMTVVDAMTEGASRGRGTRHTLWVLATITADAVTAAGGLMFDAVGTGWNVTLFLATSAAQRAVQILGVDSGALSAAVDSELDLPDALVVAAELYQQDTEVRELFAAATESPGTEVALWGGDWPPHLGSGSDSVEHRLSSAARAFKVHAMDAAGVAPRITPTETFRSGKRRSNIEAPLLPLAQPRRFRSRP